MGDAERVAKIAALLRLEAERIVALKQFFDTGDTRAAAEALGYFDEGHVATLIRGAAMEAMAMACAKAWDSPGSERYTLPAARKLIADPATFHAVAQHGDTAALKEFERLMDEMSADYSRARLKDFRNYRLAHHLPERFEAVDRPKLLHLWNLIDDTVRTVFFLGKGSGVVTVTMEAAASVWAKRCSEYWQRLLKGPHGRQVLKRPAANSKRKPRR